MGLQARHVLDGVRRLTLFTFRHSCPRDRLSFERLYPCRWRLACVAVPTTLSHPVHITHAAGMSTLSDIGRTSSRSLPRLRLRQSRIARTYDPVGLYSLTILAVRLQVFVRGGLLLLVADSPQRAQVLFCKHPNGSTRHPCPYCTVEQSELDEGGELGDPQYDIDVNRRTRRQMDEGRRELEALASDPAAQTKRSMELGVVPPDSNAMPRPLFDWMDIDPLRHVPVERLHADALVSLYVLLLQVRYRRCSCFRLVEGYGYTRPSCYAARTSCYAANSS